MGTPPRIVVADTTDRGRMHYLVDQDLNFVPEVKAYLDYKAATKSAPLTLRAICFRLRWLYHFMAVRDLTVGLVEPQHLTDFALWLSNPYRDVGDESVIGAPRPLQDTTINQILRAAGPFFQFLVRRKILAQSPVVYVDVPRGHWQRERDLLAHTRRGPDAQTVRRMETLVKERRMRPKVVPERDFQTFLDSIRIGDRPGDDPSGFRDRLICLLLKEGGFRRGELLGMRVEDCDFRGRGVHVRFREDNQNGARAKAGRDRDRFVHLAADIMELLDIFIGEVWEPGETDHLWLVLKRDARDRAGRPTYGTALDHEALSSMFGHYSDKSGVKIHPHMLRHTHATELVRSFLRDGKPVDWKFVQERLGHASVVTTMETYVHLCDDDRALA